MRDLSAETSRRPAAFRVFLLLAISVADLSCSSESGSADSGVLDAASSADAGMNESTADAGHNDAGLLDSGVGDASPVDAGAMSSGATCSFNRDCPANERCECDQTTGCQCLIGPRGTGRLGVDACQTGEDCESSVCLEGPNNELVCSGPCEDASDCGGLLPICADIAFVGRICIRDPNG